MFEFQISDFSLTGIFVFLLIALVLFFFIGLAVKKWFVKKNLTKGDTGLGTLEGALLSLFAFFMAFSFSMATDRYNARREAIISEANTIGTALLRADLYPDSVRNNFRESFKTYLKCRIDYYNAGSDTHQVATSLIATGQAGHKLWSIISSHSQDPHFYEPNRLMVPAMNEMIDAVTTRDAALNSTVPESIIWVLLILSLCSSFIVGYGTKEENVNYIVGSIFVIMISVSLTLIIDLDRPRKGLITNSKAHQKIMELRGMFQE